MVEALEAVAISVQIQVGQALHLVPTGEVLQAIHSHLIL